MADNRLCLPDGSCLEYRIQDCLEGMKGVPDETIDLVLTDPPFNVGIDYGDSTDDDMDDEGYSDWIRYRLIEMARVLKSGHVAVVFSGDKKIHPIMDAIDGSAFTFHHFLKWHKPSCQRALSGLVLFYRTELAFLLSKGKPDQSILHRSVLYADTLVYDNTTPGDKDAVDHPCRRPEDLYVNLIKGLTDPGDTVLDPFLGSGTTLLACRMSGRNGLGFEINPEFETVIRKRILANVRTLDEFI